MDKKAILLVAAVSLGGCATVPESSLDVPLSVSGQEPLAVDNFPLFLSDASSLEDEQKLVGSVIFQSLADKWKSGTKLLTTCVCFEKAVWPVFITFPRKNGQSWDCPAGWYAACRIDWQAGDEQPEPLSDVEGVGWGLGGEWLFSMKFFQQRGTIDNREVFKNRVFYFQGEGGPSGKAMPYGPYLDFYLPQPED